MWYGVILSFLSFTAKRKPENYMSGQSIFCFLFTFKSKYYHIADFEVAFIKYFQVAGKDYDSKLTKLTWDNVGTRWQLVEIENIFKIVHVVPMFERIDDSYHDTFLLNNFIWRV